MNETFFGSADGATYRANGAAALRLLDQHRAERIAAETFVVRCEVDAQVARRQLADHDRAQARARLPW